METSPPPSTLNLIKVLSTSRRIIHIQLSHFTALSFLFILPFAIAAAVYPILQSPLPKAISKSFLYLIGFGPQQANDQFTTLPNENIFLVLTYVLFTVVFSTCAITSITYSVIQGFSSQPVKLKTAVKSIAANFFPLLGTSLLAQMIISACAILYAAVFALLVAGAQLLGFQIDFSSTYFIILGFVMVIPLFLFVVYLHVNWCLVSVVVVAEKTWGLEPLKRSASLIKGRRWLALSLSLLFAFCYGVLSISTNYSLPVVDLDGGSTNDTNHKWMCLVISLAVQVLFTSAFRVLVLLYELVSNTVLYMYCKEAGLDNRAEGFAGEYVSLPVDDNENDPRSASV
ncbi:hypothetical protein CsatA_016120 [Cannabis sativa]